MRDLFRHQEHVKREKQVMAECDCPFMVNLVTSFKDSSHLYMLMECVMGGELFTYLQSRSGPLKEDHARFYTASVVCGLEYMQERNLMWRYTHSASLCMSNLVLRDGKCRICPCHCLLRVPTDVERRQWGSDWSWDPRETWTVLAAQGPQTGESAHRNDRLCEDGRLWLCQEVATGPEVQHLVWDTRIPGA